GRRAVCRAAARPRGACWRPGPSVATSRSPFGSAARVGVRTPTRANAASHDFRIRSSVGPDPICGPNMALKGPVAPVKPDSPPVDLRSSAPPADYLMEFARPHRLCVAAHHPPFNRVKAVNSTGCNGGWRRHWRVPTCRAKSSFIWHGNPMSLDIATLFAAREAERYALHARHLNEQLVRVLKTVGFDVGFCQGDGQYLVDRQGTR